MGCSRLYGRHSFFEVLTGISYLQCFPFQKKKNGGPQDASFQRVVASTSDSRKGLGVEERFRGPMGDIPPFSVSEQKW